MITRIWEGRNESGFIYYQGMVLMKMGRLKGTWKPVTKACVSILKAQA